MMSRYAKNATIVYREDINKELSIIRVKPDEGEVAEFKPGQYAELAVPTPEQENPQEGVKPEKLLRRSYSIASNPSVKDALEFYVVLVPEGALTPKLWDLKEGDRLWLGPKVKGKFTLDGLPEDKDFIMVATGTGLAPFLSMYKEFRKANKWNKYVLIHGVRIADDLGYKKELEQFAEEDPNFVYVPMCTREPEGSAWQGPRGRVNILFETSEAFESKTGVPLSSDSSHVFLCGNPAMIDTVQESLEAKDFTQHSKKNPGNIHFERYW